jgi:hypothetical protein
LEGPSVVISNIALKIAPFGRLDAPQAARHLVQRYAARLHD